jgi:membrane protease YdiL (CAAX protease family)
MIADRNNWLKRHPLLAFFVLAFLISWVIEIPLALTIRGYWRSNIPFSLHYLAGYGPMLSAMIVTVLSGGKVGTKHLFKRMIRWRVKPIWWLVAISPLIVFLLVGIFQYIRLYTRLYETGVHNLPVYLHFVIEGLKTSLLNLGWVNFLPGLGLLALPMWFLTFGMGEETGWRGFALPRLQEKHSPLKASIILWLLWAFWHTPLFFYTYDLAILPGFLTGLLAGAIALTWLYNGTGGSILITAIWHSAFNTVTACVMCGEGSTAAVISAAVMVLAVFLIFYYLVQRKKSAQKETLANHQPG